MPNYTPSDYYYQHPSDYSPSSRFEFSDVYEFEDLGAYSPSGIFDFTDVTLSTPNAGEFNVALEDATGDLLAFSYDNIGDFSVITEDASGSFIAEYNVNVLRLLTVPTCSQTEDTGEISDITCMTQDQGTPKTIDKTSSQDNAGTISDITCMTQDQGSYLTETHCSNQDDAGTISDITCMTQDQGTKVNTDCIESAIEQVEFIDSGICSSVHQMTVVDPAALCSKIQDSSIERFDQIISIPVDDDTDPRFTPNCIFNIIVSDYSPSSVFQFESIDDWEKVYLNYIEGHYLGPIRNGINTSWDEATYSEIKRCSLVQETKHPDRGRTPWIDLPRPDPDPDPPSGSTYIVPVKEVYTVLNTILVTLDDGITPIQLDALNLSIDADSYTWNFTAELIDPAEIVLIKQLPDGTAIKLFITINGYTWHVLVEKITTNRTFGRESVKLSGRGLTGLLSKPYEQPISVSFGVTKNVDQLVDLILPIGWNDAGDLYWLLGDDPIGSPVTWSVDAGAYSYTNRTPIEAIGDLTKDIGVMIVPSRDTQEIYFKSRYPVMPWNFDSVIVDIAIPDAAILQLSEEPVSSFQANGVYIHGGEIGGEFARVRLNGTAGDRLAPTVSNNLMTDPDGIRHLGGRILSGQYAQPKIKSITTFMDGTTVPLIDIGDFVGLTVDAVETRGIVNAVGISAKHGEVMQTITIGESTPNTWVAFKEILPKDPVLVGEVTSTDGITSLMLLADKVGVVRVRGTGTVGLNYYIQGGAIIDQAPNITQLADIVL